MLTVVVDVSIYKSERVHANEIEQVRNKVAGSPPRAPTRDACESNSAYWSFAGSFRIVTTSQVQTDTAALRLQPG